MKSGEAPDRLPSLNAIRVFEAVGRLLSYAGAAEELHVTTSAVSHQIKALEAYLCVQLLHRQGQNLTLTPAGKKYFLQVYQGLTQLSMATGSLLRAKGARLLRVSVAPSLATWWLMPRLDRFLTAFPDINLEVAASIEMVDFARGDFDAAIRYCRHIGAGLYATALGKNEVFPVCSPLLMQGPFPLRNPADLQRHILIDTGDVAPVDEPLSKWDGWLRASGNPQITGVRQLHLTPRHLTLQAVTQGMGVGLARTLMAAEAIGAGQLVCPFGPALSMTGNYYLVCPEANAKSPEVAAFRDWLLAEASASVQSIKIPGPA